MLLLYSFSPINRRKQSKLGVFCGLAWQRRRASSNSQWRPAKAVVSVLDLDELDVLRAEVLVPAGLLDIHHPIQGAMDQEGPRWGTAGDVIHNRENGRYWNFLVYPSREFSEKVASSASSS